jgi:hypothetical protein
VYGRTDGDGEAGHFEINNSNSSSNVLSGSTNGTGYGVHGKHSSNGNYGYLGGSSNGAFGYSVEGNGVSGTSLNSNGVRGSSVNGTGVEGYSLNGVAVSGETSGESGHGVYGYSKEGSGVFGNSPDGIAVQAEGDLKVSGAYKGNISSTSGFDGAPFPRPAYDSGWVSINQNEPKRFTHNIGGNVDDYVVDMIFKDQTGINIIGFGGDEGDYIRGASWYGLTNQEIDVHRSKDDHVVDQIRIRIWVVK